MRDGKLTSVQPFQLVKIISWSLFVLVIGANLVLSLFLANYARQTLLQKQETYAALLAANINHQVFQRFTKPTVLAFGRIQLSNEVQYDHLSKVMASAVTGFNIQELRIYDLDQTVSFSTTAELVGRKDLAGPQVAKVLEGGGPSYVLISQGSAWQHFFDVDMEPGSVLLRTITSMRADRRLDRADADAGPIMGALEFTQDITADYATVVTFQRLIILAIVFTSLLLVIVLMTIIRRADQMAAERAREKERLERDLLQNEKLASMGRMVSGVAHEIRNPLGIIRSSAELLLGKAKAENSPNIRILQALFDESKRLSRTVNDFLDYARPKQLRQDDVDLVAVINQAVVFLEPKCREQGVDIHRRLPDQLWVKGDKDLLYRAVYNVLANGLDALSGNGAAPGNPPAGSRHEIRIGGGHEAGQAIIAIEDTGPGFPAESLGHVLDPFFTTKDNGTGLGLAIVDTVVKGHGGRVHLANGPRGGAMVELRLPAGQPPA